LFGHLWEVELTYRYIFAFKCTLRSQHDTSSKIAAGINDTGGKFPPVSTTLAKVVAKFAASVIDTGGKFAAGVVDTGGKLDTGVVETGGAP
jgi:hypothetical protein